MVLHQSCPQLLRPHCCVHYAKSPSPLSGTVTHAGTSVLMQLPDQSSPLVVVSRTSAPSAPLQYPAPGINPHPVTPALLCLGPVPLLTNISQSCLPSHRLPQVVPRKDQGQRQAMFLGRKPASSPAKIALRLSPPWWHSGPTTQSLITGRGLLPSFQAGVHAATSACVLFHPPIIW